MVLSGCWAGCVLALHRARRRQSVSAGGLARVYTSGGGARIPGLNEALASRLKVPVELASPIQRLAYRQEAFETVSVDEIAPLLMLSVGLALRRAA